MNNHRKRYLEMLAQQNCCSIPQVCALVSGKRTIFLHELTPREERAFIDRVKGIGELDEAGRMAAFTDRLHDGEVSYEPAPPRPRGGKRFARI